MDQNREAISKLLKAGHRFSVIFDEWMSISNKRFMSVYAHSKEKSFNLSLANITGSAASENLLSILKTRLEKFSLKIDDVVEISSDGTNPMKCLQASTEAISQTCWTQGFHLAVKDSLNVSTKDLSEKEIEKESDEYVDQLLSSIYFRTFFMHDLTKEQVANAVKKYAE